MTFSQQPLRTAARSELRRRGFTLTEVVLALGVMGLAFVPLLGLLPVGMGNFRSSMDRSAAARVAECLANEARQSDFEQVQSSGNDLLFDGQGNEVRDREAAVFQAKLMVLDEDPHLKRLIIQVARNPGGAVDLAASEKNGLWDEGSGLAMTTRSVLLARLSSE